MKIVSINIQTNKVKLRDECGAPSYLNVSIREREAEPVISFEDGASFTLTEVTEAVKLAEIGLNAVRSVEV